MSHLPDYARSAIQKALTAARVQNDPIEPLVAALALQYGVDRATIFRAAQYGARPVPRAALSLYELRAIARHQGNRHQAWRTLQTEQGYPLSYSQFCRRLLQTPTDFAAAVTEGMKAMIAAGSYGVSEGTYARGEVFGFDHTEVPVFTYRPGDNKAAKQVWHSHVVDWSCGLIIAVVFTLGEATSGHPNTETIVALVGSALIGTEIGGVRAGGKPATFVFDNAAEHLAEACQRGFIALAQATHTIRVGSPWENGSTESMVNVIEQSVWSQLPGYSHHLPTRYGKFPWKNDELLTPEELMAHTLAGVDRINCDERPAHLNGKTRIETWASDPSMIEFADPVEVRHNFLAAKRASYKITKKGVFFKDGWYSPLGPEFHGKVGRSVALKYLPNDHSFVDVYMDHQFLCTATRATTHDRETRSRNANVRRARQRRADVIVKESRARVEQRERLAEDRAAFTVSPAGDIDPVEDEDFLGADPETAAFLRDHRSRLYQPPATHRAASDGSTDV